MALPESDAQSPLLFILSQLLLGSVLSGGFLDLQGYSFLSLGSSPILMSGVLSGLVR
jgi:hypothetical protein